MNRAVRREPRWRYPVGEGAKRVRAGVVGRAVLGFLETNDFLGSNGREEIARLEDLERWRRHDRHV